ncbi:hypothetical protein RV12_GL000421 [Enterococcus quebecensis]|nr:hypothetical protein RV12_GL000421 [Enterococcus quebecensis]
MLLSFDKKISQIVLLLNTALVELTVSGAIGLTPEAQLISVFPLFQSAYDVYSKKL